MWGECRREQRKNLSIGWLSKVSPEFDGQRQKPSHEMMTMMMMMTIMMLI